MLVADRTLVPAGKFFNARCSALSVMIAILAAVAIQLLGGGASAQPIKQMKLTDKHIESFIAAQKDMTAIAEKMQGATSDKPDPKIQAELEAVAKKYGFASFNDYDDVSANIAMIMAGFDPVTKQFTEPRAAIEKEIKEVTADSRIPDNDKKQMLVELNEALKAAEPIQNAGNIELIKKNFDKLDAALQ
jgi:hypothetical protein